MNVSFKATPDCTITADVKDAKQAFEFIAYAQTLFGVRECGNCESRDLKLRHTTPQGYNYYSIECRDCRYQFKFGQQREAPHHLFPKGWEPPFKGDGNGKSADSQEDSYQDEDASTEEIPF